MPRLFGVFAVLASVYYLHCLAEPRERLMRTVALGAALLYNAALLPVHGQLHAAQRVLGEAAGRNYFERQWPNLQRLRITELASAGRFLHNASAELRTLGLQTFADLHRQAMAEYQVQESRLRWRWGTEDEQKLKALFLMNFVAGMWAYGNKFDVDTPGGVLDNEDNHCSPEMPTLRTYLDADIACCTDFAYMTKALLDHEGLDNRLTAIPGHVFNEVHLGGRWCILDPTANLCAETSWEELYGSPEVPRNAIRVLLFPHPGCDETDAARYRPLAGHFRLLTLMRIANRPLHLREANYPELPEHFH